MKLPNLRMFETQATMSAGLAITGAFLLAALAYCSLHGFVRDQMVILYNPNGAMGKFRPIIVNGLTAVTVFLGFVAAILGFRSLGEKRNTRQRRSWIGLWVGAGVAAIAPVLWQAWSLLNEAKI